LGVMQSVKSKKKTNNKRNHHELYQYVVLLLLFSVLVIWALLHFFSDATFLDVCWWDRSLNESTKNFSLITKVLFNTSTFCMLLFFLQVAAWRPPFGTNTKLFTINNLFGITFTLIWYVVTYLICLCGKEILADYRCGARSNSISGHYTFHVYYFLALPYAYLSVVTYEVVEAKKDDKTKKIRLPRKNPSAWFSHNEKNFYIFGIAVSRILALTLTFAVFAITATLTLTRTLLYGYHSVRQILYGVILGIVSNYTAFLLRRHVGASQPLYLAGATTGALLLLSLIVLSYGPIPLEPGEKFAYGAAWLGMLYCSWEKHRHITRKKKIN